MADVLDVLAASRETDTALEMLRAYCDRLETTGASDEPTTDVALVLGRGFMAVADAIRENATRIDYAAWKTRSRG